MSDKPRLTLWERIFGIQQIPAYARVGGGVARCPECRAPYGPRDRYCPGCHEAVPEWRFG